MKLATKSVVAGAALLGSALAGSAQADVDYLYSATGFLSGGGIWIDRSASGIFFIPGDNETDGATIVGGGDFVLPLSGYWNVQLGGTFYTEYFDYSVVDDTITQFQGSAIGFWRDPAAGVFGLEAGFFSPSPNFAEFVKLGGVAEYFFEDTATIGAYGGAFIPLRNSTSSVGGTGFYVGGHATWYASHDLAFSGFARYNELDSIEGDGVGGEFPSFTSGGVNRHLVVGGKVRHLTSLPGVEVFASAAYRRCEESVGSDIPPEVEVPIGFGGDGDLTTEGLEIMVGINVRLGGHTDSLLNIDRSNSIDTDTWACRRGPIDFEFEPPQIPG